MADFDEIIAARVAPLQRATTDAQAVVAAGAAILAARPIAEQARDQAAASAAQVLATTARKEFNLFTRAGYLNETGALTADANWQATPLIDLSLIDIVSLNLLGHPSAASIAIYDVNRALLSKVSAPSKTDYVTAMPALPAGATYAAFTRASASTDPAVAPLLAAQRFDFNTAYRNVPTAAAFSRKEFGLFTRAGYYGGTGAFTNDVQWATTDLIDVGLIDVTSLAFVGHPNVAAIGYFGADRMFMSKVSAASDGGIYTGYPAPPAGAAFVAFSMRANAAVAPGVQKFDYNLAYRNLPTTADRTAQADRESKAFAIFTRVGYIDATGALKGDQNWLSTEMLDLGNFKSFSVRLKGHTAVASVAFYDAAKVFISAAVASAIGAYVAMPAIPAGAVYVTFTSNKDAAERFFSVLSPTALPSPALLAGRFPVEISGSATISGSYFATDGTIKNDANWRRSTPVRAAPGDTFAMTLYGHPSVAALEYLDAAKARIGFYAPGGSSGAMFTTVQVAPAGTAFVRFSFGDPAKLSAATSASIKTEVSVASLYAASQGTPAVTATPLLAPFRAPRRLPFVAGMKNLLYGDSRSSTDYTWYKTQMEALTGASWYNGGFSGHTVAQNASEADLQRVWDYGAQGAIVSLPGGNDGGVQGTVGTFNGTVADEPVMVPSDYSAAYAGTTFIQAVDYQIGRIKRFYDNIRARAALTGSESEADKNAAIRALNKPMLVLLTDLPQQRTNAAHSWSLPESWRRKRDAIVEVGHRHKVHTIDTMYELSLDMSIEPFFVGPTDKNTNNGVYTMDGLHLNEFGYERLTRRIAADLG